jgi:predicted negative regulator of RcsB-dependent stress response|tara:strand:- start:3103 stop:3747 length:645 start_codon:yes stop_codon:yes gene_type:complete
MDEDIAVINKKTRNEKIANFFLHNKKKIIIITLAIIIIILGYLINQNLKKKNEIEISNRYNTATINFISGHNSKIEDELIYIINKKNKTYSPLSLYFLIDNNIIIENEKINELFDVVINETNLEKEIKNLVIYKKALFNSNFNSENNLMQILQPLLSSNSIWESHALYLMGEYFFSRGEKNKSKEFFNKILILKNSNLKIKNEVQKILNRDFSD